MADKAVPDNIEITKTVADDADEVVRALKPTAAPTSAPSLANDGPHEHPADRPVQSAATHEARNQVRNDFARSDDKPQH